MNQEDYVQGRVSAIVRVCKYSTKIRSCIEALLNEVYEDLEIVLLDMENVGRTKEIIKEICNENKAIKLVSEASLDEDTALYQGLEEATGEFVLFMEPEDILKKGMLTTVIQKMKDRDYDRVIFRKRQCNNNKKKKRPPIFDKDYGHIYRRNIWKHNSLHENDITSEEYLIGIKRDKVDWLFSSAPIEEILFHK